MGVDCPYYREHRRALRNHEVPVDAPITWVTIPYCWHKHSPAALEKVANMPGGWLVLVCGGNVDHCQIAVGDRLDIS